MSARFSFISVTLGLCLLFFQNCSPVNHTNGEDQSSKAQSESGPYTGLQKVYRYFDTVAPCSSRDKNGNPLPNAEILIRPNGQGNLAPFSSREQCLDVSPVELAASDVQVSGQTITYKKKAYTSGQTPGDFDVVAAACPAGRTPLANPNRVNVLSDSLDWTGSSWDIYQGVSVSLYSTISSLPAYLIQRNDSAHLDYWVRDNQGVSLQANTQYAYSFLVQPGSVTGAEWNVYRDLGGNPNDEGARVTFNFLTLTTTINYAQHMAGLTATIAPFGNAYLCTVYFTSSPTDNQAPNMLVGVGPSANGATYGNLGDSIIVTAAQLVPVNQFCQ